MAEAKVRLQEHLIQKSREIVGGDADSTSSEGSEDGVSGAGTSGVGDGGGYDSNVDDHDN